MAPPTIQKKMISAPPPGSVCQNCHDEKKPTLHKINPKTFQNESSLFTQCPVEPFWPSSLKTYQEYLKEAPLLRKQNKVEAFILSRSGTFPIELDRASLEFYFGLQAPLSIPKVSLLPASFQIATSPNSCIGNIIGDPEALNQCSGITALSLGEDFGIALQDVELFQFNELNLEWSKVFPSVQIKGLRIEDRKILVSIKASDALWNVGILFKNLPITLKPNPYDPTLHDIDLTPVLLKNLPVAYNPITRSEFNFLEYQSIPQTQLNTLPYFLEIARENELPPYLSLPEIFKAVTELNRNVDRKPTKPSPLQEAVFRSIDHVVLKLGVRPRRIVYHPFLIDFNRDHPPIQAEINFKNLQNYFAKIETPIAIQKLIIPHRLDLSDIKGQLSGQVNHQLNVNIKLNYLDLNLQPMEYLRPASKAQGTFAILGGNIHSESEVLLEPPPPAISVTGNLKEGLEIETNFKMEGLTFRLPMLGNISISGNFRGKALLTPHQKSPQNGPLNIPANYSIKPDSLKISIKNLEVTRNQSRLFQNGNLEITTDPSLTTTLTIPDSRSKERSTVIKIGIPSFLTQEGKINFEQINLADLEVLKNLGSGFQEIWKLHFAQEKSEDTTTWKIYFSGKEQNPTQSVKRDLVEDLMSELKTKRTLSHTNYDLSVKAAKINFSKLHLIEPELKLKVVQQKEKEGKTEITIPQFRISANQNKKSNHGFIQGDVKLHSFSNAQRPLSLFIDKIEKSLTIKNINLRFELFKIVLEKLAKITKSKVIGADIDGRVFGHWKLNYETFQGAGNIIISGDGQGDIHLIGPDGERLKIPDPRNPSRDIGTPLILRSKWQINKMNGINFEKQILDAPFVFYTQVNPISAKIFGVHFQGRKFQYYRVPHNHMPYTLEGFERMARDYLARRERELKKHDSETIKRPGGIEP